MRALVIFWLYWCQWCQWRHLQHWRSIGANGDSLASLTPLVSMMVMAPMTPVALLISMCNGACKLWKTHCHWMMPMTPLMPMKQLVPMSPMELFSPLTTLSPLEPLPPLALLPTWQPSYDQCIIIVPNGIWIVIVAIGANVATVAIGRRWCHKLSLDVLTFTSPRNGAYGAISMATLITDGDRHWCQWWSSLELMAMGCVIGAIWSITIGANASPLAPFFVAIGANGANGEISKSFWPLPNFYKIPPIICWSRNFEVVTVWSLDPMVVLVWACLFLIHFILSRCWTVVLIRCLVRDSSKYTPTRFPSDQRN